MKQKDIQMPIPKEISSFKPKIMLGMTFRQLICGSIGIVSTVVIYALLGKYIPSNDLKVILSGLVMVPCVCLGWIEPYGMSFEKFIITYIQNCILSPSVRKYKAENNFEIFEKDMHKYFEAEEKKDKSKKKRKKKKYKKSKDAFL